MNKILVVSMLLLPIAAQRPPPPPPPPNPIEIINTVIAEAENVIDQASGVITEVNNVILPGTDIQNEANNIIEDVNGVINDATQEADTVASDIVNDVQACFSSHTTVDVEGKGIVTMDNIQVGDRVLTANGNYGTIYSIDHRHPTKSTHFIQIHHANEAPLELTPKHMLFVEGNANPIPAASVKVGDEVQTLQGPAQVTKIDTVTRAGLFSPLTVDGTIVASGIIASSYSAFLSNDEWMIDIAGMKIMSHQSFYNMALKPYRYICTGLSLDLCKTSNEKVAISQFANDLYDHSNQYGQLYQKAMLSLVVLFVCIYNLILSPYTLVMIGTYSMTRIFKKSKLLA